MNLSNILKQFKKQEDHHSFKKEKDMRKTWVMLLVLFAVLIVGVAGAGFFLYKAFVVVTPKQEPNVATDYIDVEEINRTLEVFKQKEENFNTYIQNPKAIEDPSV